MSKLDFHYKANYIISLITENGKLTESDNLACKYLYEMVSFLVQRKLNTKNLPSDYNEEIIQNVVSSFFIRFGTNKEKNKEFIRKCRINSILPYLSFCVMAEFSALNRNRYLGQDYIKSGYDFHLELDEIEETGEFGTNFNFEADSFYHFLKVTKKIIIEVKKLINEAVIPVQNKELFLFPLLLAIMREDHRMLLVYPLRIRVILRHIFNEVGSPLERIKK